MPKLECESIANKEGFQGNGAKNAKGWTWGDSMRAVDKLQQTWGFNQGVKTLFFELIQTGQCYSTVVQRIEVVREILVREGYLPFAQLWYTDEELKEMGEKC